MTNDEILKAAKEAGLLHKDAQTASQIVFDFAAIIEKRTIERCAEKLLSIGALGDGDFLAAIRAIPTGQIKLEELL